MAAVKRLAFLLACLIAVAACDDETSGPGDGDEFGTGLLLPWSQLSGRIVYATPVQLMLIDAVNRDVQLVRQVLSDEVVVELDMSPTRAEVAVGGLVDRGSPRIAISRLSDGAIVRVVDRALCPRYLRDGRLSYMRGDSVLVEGSRVAVVASATACPAWSVDGTYFVIPVGMAVHRVTANDGGAQPIIESAPAGKSWFDLDTSPAGQTLALVAAGSTSPNEVYLADAAGKNLRRVALGTGLFGATWAPNGQQMVAVSTTSGAAGLFVIGATGMVEKLAEAPVYAATWGQ